MTEPYVPDVDWGIQMGTFLCLHLDGMASQVSRPDSHMV